MSDYPNLREYRDNLVGWQKKFPLNEVVTGRLDELEKLLGLDRHDTRTYPRLVVRSGIRFGPPCTDTVWFVICREDRAGGRDRLLHEFDSRETANNYAEAYVRRYWAPAVRPTKLP